MSKIIKQDTQGTKPLLQVGEFGYDNWVAGGDIGRVYVGTGSSNIAIAKKAEVAAVDSKADTHITRVDNPHGVTKAQVGLGNADNTADSTKVVASAGKLTTARNITLGGDVTGTVSFDGSADVTVVATIAANSVALGVDTTGNYVAGVTAGTGITVGGTAGEGWTPSVAITNVGIAGTYTKVTTNAQGQVTNGATLSAGDIPSLDASKITSGVIDAARLPAYVDDVLEFANLAGFPAVGETGKIYVALDTNKAYRWSGSAYIYITSGAVDSVAGKTGVVTLVKADVGLANVDNTSDIDKPISTAVQTALDTKQAVLVSGTNIKTIEGQSIVGSGNIDLSKGDVGLSNVDNTADSSKVVASAGKWTTSRNITIGNSTKSVDGTGNVAWTLAEIGAIGPASPALTGVPTAPTAAVNTNTTQLATTAFVNAEIANDAVPRVTSTDNAVVRFNGTTGDVQNSGVIIDDNGNVGIGTSNTLTRLHITSNNSPLASGQPQFIISGDANKERIAVRSSIGGSVINVGNCGGTIESPSSVTNGMFLGSYQFGGYAGSTSMWTRGAQIAGFANGGWTDTSHPAGISFMTVPSESGILTERMRIDSSGNVLVTSPAGIGYGTGAGGTVTQLTSKSTAVTLNKPVGQIIMNNVALAAGSTVGFYLNNSLLSTGDLVYPQVDFDNGAFGYNVWCGLVQNGAVFIQVKNVTAGSLSDAIRIKFAIIKGAIA